MEQNKPDEVKDFPGLIPTILQEGQVVELNLSQPFDLKKCFTELFEYEEKQRKWKKESGWKPEMHLTAYEAKNLPYGDLEYLCETYNVMVGLEAANIIREREKTKK